ncbi:uncharacterized protein LOC143204842 isoform X3 [Rhynchophorus ferrugineus]|uniref:uncharacterized protein LOC143204842 isoform X3 n=1 Tax=Rhynchophorus ferrugineus TaxID=354439 RepID=UPI003FCECDA9
MSAASPPSQGMHAARRTRSLSAIRPSPWPTAAITAIRLRFTVRPPSQRHPQPIQIVYQATITREHAQPSEPVEYLQSGHQHGASIIHYNQMNVCSQATNTGPTARTAFQADKIVVCN